MGEDLRQGQGALPSFSATSLASLSWAWSDFYLLPSSSAWISCTAKDGSLKPLGCNQWDLRGDFSSWYKLESLTPLPMEFCLELEKKVNQRVWSSTWSSNLPAVPPRSRSRGLLTIPFVLFHHFLFILIIFIINTLTEGLPPPLLFPPIPTLHPICILLRILG